MRVLRIFAAGIFVLGLLAGVHAQSTNTNSTTTLLGQWDFNSANLGAATSGSPLQFIGGLQGAFETVPINGRPAGVMNLPGPVSPDQSLLAPFTPLANGGGTNLNQYTILMDVMWPGESDFTWRALFNATTNNQEDAEIFVNPDNQLGIYNDYAFNLLANQWHRLVLVYDLTNPATNLIRYLNGDITNAAPQRLEESGVDGRFSLRGGLLFFSDNDGETARVYVNSIQLRGGAMTPEEVAALGGPSSGGLGQGPDPVGDVSLSIVRSGDSIIITTNPSRNAQLEKATSLTNPNWQSQGAPASSFTNQIVATERTAFFRVRL